MWAFLVRYRRFFLYAGFFSFVINLLLLAPALYTLQVFDRVLASRHVESLVMLTLVTAGALFFLMLLEVVRSELLTRAAVAIEQTVGPRVFASLLDTVHRRSGEGTVHGLRDVATMRSFLTGPGILALFDAPWLVVYVAVIYLFHPIMGAVAVGGALFLLLLALLNERLTREALEALQTEGRRAGRFVDAGLRNADTIGALGMGPEIVRAWQRLDRRALEMQMAASHWAARIGAMTRFSRQGVQVAMLGTGAWLVIGSNVSPGVMIAATILFGRALAPVETVIAGWRALVEARSAAARLREYVADTAAAVPIRLPDPKGNLVVDRVVVSVRGRDRPILRGVSMAAAPGESVAILGPSAAGKSTLARLIVGAWKPASGTVRLDGADISAWPDDSLGRHVGYLPQDVELFAGTVGENIARFDRGDDAAIAAAAQAAHAHELILQLPQGYDTRVGEDGLALSGGQRQRIALARALYRSPRLVVLDEPDAHLDLEGIQALERTIRGLGAQGVTTVVVSHRRSIVTDKVLFLRDGVAGFFGTRQQFLAKALETPEAG